jgi:hypothetical protein
MSKFNKTTVRAAHGNGPIKSESTPSLSTFNGAPGFAREAKSELFLAAVSDFGGEGTFYESATNRSARIARLTHEVAKQDAQWLTEFTTWLRNEANLRSISITIAMEGAKALNQNKIEGGRKLVAGAIRRADEAGEALAYWFENFGRKMPSSVKRGIADGAVKSFNEYSLAKYDTASKGFRFGDVIELTHPSPKDAKQSELFKFALDRRRDASAEPSESLTMLQKRKEFLALSGAEKRKLVESGESERVLSEAGLTWEVLASTIDGGMDAKAWEAVIPSMGYMALLRNLRNFEEKGVSEAVLAKVAARIADPEEVAKSRQLPFRFLSAFRANSGSLRWGFPLEQALKASLENVPALDGHTLILVDTSASMYQDISKKTDLTYADSAALFGSALAVRADKATLVQFGASSHVVDFKKTDSVLTTVKKFRSLGGTATHDAIVKNFNPSVHTRVILITDEQVDGYYHRLNGRGNASYWSGWERVKGDILEAIPAKTPVFTWNFAGYAAGHGESKRNRTYLGGLSDQAFKLIPLIEAGYDAGWPWERK